MRYLPHTPEDIERMLGVVGKPSIDALFDHIPPSLRTNRPIDIAPLSEPELLTHLQELAALSQPATASFLGAGLIPHAIPTAVDMLLQRAEWYTSYTPYQPEISQGTLQAVFEFQTIVGELFGLPVANASMYDGASGTAEAVLMSQRLTERERVLTAATLHPQSHETIATYLGGDPAWDPASLVRVGATVDGRVDLDACRAALAAAPTACLVVQSPNFFGCVEDVAALAAICQQHGTLLVVANTEPLAFGLYEAPGVLGADIAVSDGLGLASGPSSGGPGVGLFASKSDFVRQLPGRLVGETVDRSGKRGYVLTLATREQHIRREKATSNICTNQGLIALAFTIHLCLLGKRGFSELAQQNYARASYALDQLVAKAGCRRAFAAPFFNEIAVEVRGGDAGRAVRALASRGLHAGVAPRAAGLLPDASPGLLLVAVTEQHSRATIDHLVNSLDEVTR